MCVKSNLTDEKKKWRDNKMTWIKTMFGTEKAIIGLLHLKALPGDPFYEGDMKAVIKQAETDLEALQAGGVDGILITNEFSLPYEKKVSKVTVAAMARVVGAIEKKLKVPYGVEVIYDADATIEVCAATGADFSRCVFTGAFAGDLGIVDKDIAKTLRLRRALGIQDLKLFYFVNSEGEVYLNDREWEDVIVKVVIVRMRRTLLYLIIEMESVKEKDGVFMKTNYMTGLWNY